MPKTILLAIGLATIVLGQDPRQQGKVTAPGAARFGGAVAISGDGNTLVVGASVPNSDTGTAWVFTRSNDAWTAAPVKLEPTSRSFAQLAGFGYSVAISADGSTIAVGDPAATRGQGCLWIYTRNAAGNWIRLPQLFGDGDDNAMGLSVAVSANGGRVVAGAPRRNFAWVFDRKGDQGFGAGRKLFSGDPRLRNKDQGSSVAISANGSIIALGAPEAGMVVLCEEPIDQFLAAPIPLPGSLYAGYSVALTADGLAGIVGDPALSRGAPAAGAYYTIARRGISDWTNSARLPVPGSLQLGIGVSMSAEGNFVLLGSSEERNGVGGVYLLQRNRATVRLAGTQSNAATQAKQGTAVAISADGNTMAWGGPGETGGGAVWIYSRAVAALAPRINAGGVVSVAGNFNGLTPLGLVSIYGANFSTGQERFWDSQRVPTNLNGTTVTIDGKPAYIISVKPDFMNVQVPDSGTRGNVPVVVSNAAGASNTVMVQMKAVAPAFKTWSGNYVEALSTTGEAVAPLNHFAGRASRPAKPGDVVSLWALGFGASNPPVAAGVIAQNTRLSNNVLITIGGIAPPRVDWLGLSGLGLYQFNVVIPPQLPDGDHEVIAIIAGERTQTGVKIQVRR